MSSTSVTSKPTDLGDPAQLIALANSCRILADCFWEPRLPDQAAWGMLLEAARQLDESMSILVEEALSEAEKLQLDDLPILFSRLFIGPFEIQAHPYASSYLDQDEAFAGRTQAEVLSYYHRGGLELPPRAGETPDHLSVELEFLYFLLVKTIQQNNKSHLELASQFATSHLKHWLPSFIQQLELAPEARFYFILSKLVLSIAGRLT